MNRDKLILLLHANILLHAHIGEPREIETRVNRDYQVKIFTQHSVKIQNLNLDLVLS